MKILVLSLLRLGDGIMISSCLTGLKEKYPNAELHILLNRECESLRDLLPAVDKFHYFERKVIQGSMGEAQRGLFEAYDRVKELTQRLSEQNYDITINLTQNKLSGYLMTSIKSGEKVGLALAPNSWVSFGSPWFRYLNATSGFSYDGVFHYTDICCGGASLSEKKRKYVLNDSGKYQFKKKTSGPVVFVQAFTSDTKKTWAMKSWVSALCEFQRLNPGADIRVLAAPSEAKIAQGLVDSLCDKDISAELLSLSLVDTYTALKSADLLVTLDTSIKHLAAAAGCKILEISLGSSDVNFTGAYSENALMIQANLGCAPCIHSKACTQQSHLCGEAVEAHIVGASMGQLLENNWLSLKTLAEEYADKIHFWKARISNSGIWYKESLAEPASNVAVRVLNQMAWKLVLNNEHLDPLSSLGSAALKLNNEIKSIGAPKSLMGEHEKHLQKRDLGFLNALSKLHKATQKSQQGEVDWKPVLDELQFDKVIHTHFVKLSQDYHGKNLFGLRQIQSHLNLWSAQTQVQLKILKALDGHIPEVLI